MLMKLGSKDNSLPDGVGEWRTGLSWYEDGLIHPITAKVFYSVPQFEVVDVTLHYDKKLIEVPSRMVSMIVATAIDEYSQIASTLRQNYQAEKQRGKYIDPLFEE